MSQRSGAKPKAAPKVVAAKEVPETKEAEATFFWENFGPGVAWLKHVKTLCVFPFFLNHGHQIGEERFRYIFI